MKLKQNAFIFKLDLNMLLGAINESVVKFKKLPQYPEVQRDLAIIIPETISWEEVEKNVKKGVANNMFKGCEVFDVYKGEHVNTGFKSLAFRIKMQDENATLTDEIIEQQMTSVREKLQKTYAQITFRE